jgi:hypothetical protein
MIPAMVVAFGAATPLEMVLAFVPLAFVLIGVGLLAAADLLVSHSARRHPPRASEAVATRHEAALSRAA